MGKTHAPCFCQLISRVFCVLHCWFGLLYSLRTCWQICQVSSTQKTKCLFLYLPMWGKYFPVLKPEVGFYFHESRCECSNQTSRLSYYSCLRFFWHVCALKCVTGQNTVVLYGTVLSGCSSWVWVIDFFCVVASQHQRFFCLWMPFLCLFCLSVEEGEDWPREHIRARTGSPRQQAVEAHGQTGGGEKVENCSLSAVLCKQNC